MTASTVPGATPPSDRILVTENLTKRYGKLVAVNKLNLEIYRGEVYGFLGPNGSGKSTTIGMVLGLVRPTSGQVQVFGVDLRKNYWQVMRRIGAIIESPAFFPYLSGWDNLDSLAQAIGGISKDQIAAALGTVGLTGRQNDSFKEYSLGMKQRLGIASTLLRDPELIILDEPTNGLDPAGTKEIRDLIPTLAHQGRTVLVSSHLLHEIEQICDRVAILKNGNLLAQGRVTDLLGRGRGLLVRVSETERALRVLRSPALDLSIKLDGAYIYVDEPVECGPRITEALAREQIYVAELRPEERSLERYFLDITEESAGVGSA